MDRALSGLEESHGALYEIGVADDGTLLGLADDEMEESINNLRVMAASLGCVVEVLRMVSVGECGWMENDVLGSAQVLKKSKLWVAEAFVRPNTGVEDHPIAPLTGIQTSTYPNTSKDWKPDSQVFLSEPTEQLRVSMTGATMSGKSSLLGSLTTATLDNGRGKSRLSLLKHRHEIVSGMTSSVTQELIGYRKQSDKSDGCSEIQIINYASNDVSSWIDIHAASASGRLVLLSDSAGHPRYRRTIVRGLIGWAPHWTLLCIPADNVEDTSGMTGSTPASEEVFGIPSVDVDLSQAHLDFCLRLQLPLIIVITKLDLASKAGLKNCLSRALSSLKAAGRRPVILPDNGATIEEADLLSIPSSELGSVDKIARILLEDSLATIPIVLTSAVKGNGIHKLHALLHELPIPRLIKEKTVHSNVLFHVEDVFTGLKSGISKSTPSLVLGGYLRYGTLNVGDELVLGPYCNDVSPEDSDSGQGSKDHPRIPTSNSFPGALHKANRLTLHRPGVSQEWRRVKVISLRNLKLPVQTLFADQVGTVGILPEPHSSSTPSISRVRKGMVLAKSGLNAVRVFTAEFARHDVEMLSIGAGVVVYVASVRASAKVISGSVAESADSQEFSTSRDRDIQDDAFDFGFEDDSGVEGGNNHEMKTSRMLVTFQFLASREYVELGLPVLIIPGGGPGLYGGSERGEKGIAGLEGFVGKVVDTAIV
jgi:GTPase